MWHLDTLHNDGTKIFIENYEKHNAILNNLKKRNDNEFMDYIFNMIKDLPVFSEMNEDLTNMKNDKKSIAYRKEGNDMFIRAKKNSVALQMYTRSIATAKFYGENLSIAYANRSAVLFECGYYKECVKDIDRALQCDCPENLKEKLLFRMQKAKSLKHAQKVYKYHEPIPEIKNKHPLIQSGSDAIQIEVNERWGRHIVAAKDIKAGEVLIVEKPYAQQVEPINMYLHCHECLELCYNMIPCEACTEVLYCSENCLQTANETYHRFECILIQLGMKVPRLFVRIFLKGILEYKSMISSKSIDKVHRSDRYKEIYDLQTHRDDKSAYDLYQDSLDSIVVYYYLKKYTDILEEVKIKKKEQILKRLLLRHQLAVLCNATCVDKPRMKSAKSNDYENVANVMYSLLSLLNHSCNANSFPVSYGSYAVLRAIRDIKKGEQITMSYGFNYNSFKKLDRQVNLKRTYYFTCTCEACVQDWPKDPRLRIGKQIPQGFIEKFSRLFVGPTVDMKVVNELLNESYEIASNMRMPSRNLNCVAGIIVELFVFAGNRLLAF